MKQKDPYNSDNCWFRFWGGAGIQADIKAASYFKVFATTAVTAVTAQNTLGGSKYISNTRNRDSKTTKISYW